MSVDWPFAWDIIDLAGARQQKIAVEDAARQQATATAILQDLASQPGMVLADEVGMGKTYVALAVAVSTVQATRSSKHPVVVMVPPGLATKWRREWQQFKTLCSRRPEALAWVRDVYVDTPTDFFKKIDDSRQSRPHIVWMTTSCFGRGLQDPWTKLMLVRLARARTKMSPEMTSKLCKWATTLIRLKRARNLTAELVERLLRSDLSRWRRILIREGVLAENADDPIPQHLLQHQNEIDWSPLIEVMRGDAIPGRRGAVSDDRLREARKGFNEACQEVYWNWLGCTRWRASLLVLDEAHHAKNDHTRLARLLRSADAQRLIGHGSGQGTPLLQDKFDRMLFLTATPFQLGHHELIRVLRSFAAAKWTGPSAPLGTRAEFLQAMDELEQRLTVNRQAGRRLDLLWGRLARDCVARYATDGDIGFAAAEWWRRINASGPTELVDRELMSAIEECRKTRQHAERDPNKPRSSLAPWVIRHNRPLELPTMAGMPAVLRRAVRAGRWIATEDQADDAATASGLPIVGEEFLPFLLAARAQGALAHGSARGRAFFAEGLCSSYEAFHHTRDNRGGVRDNEDDDDELSGESRLTAAGRPLVPVSWYENQIADLIPSRQAGEADRYSHPKMRAVVVRTVDLWLQGEKVLLFCFYRETARALREHIGREVEAATIRLVAKKLGLDAGRDAGRIRNWFERVARRLADEDSPLHRVIVDTLSRPFGAEEFAILQPHKNELVQLLAAYVRSPSFIARYMPLDVPEVREALWEASTQAQTVRAGAEALGSALMSASDASAMSMGRRVEEFLRFAREFAERSQIHAADDENRETVDPLREYLHALAVQVRGGTDDEEGNAGSGSYRVQQPVRMVYGETKRETRERLMLAFNSPLFPEILISSAVLGEGVDLHRFCRHVIHHDLCWNPSTLEQRTGRLDRIRCKAEMTRRPIVIYQPFLSGSADEKMFRVLRDRERWFQIVMGQKFDFDEGSTEALANRVPLPDELARELAFDLRRWQGA